MKKDKNYMCKGEKRRCPYSDNKGRCSLPSSEGWEIKCPPPE
jgi:hypothetical protein